ncbi:hypothetical protein SDC9_03883 [bioreactor metagenome]|uniref:Uncharacterized protein n=1 Tax=bioreactor metagenome TaxID=1076179 RepID=A0A644SXK2_9ZZZZ|nr:hypothetical protein [Negativicutes bacterium]
MIILNTTQKLDQYRVEVGDTERSTEEIIRDLKSYGEPIIHVTLGKKGAGATAAGSIITLDVTPGVFDEDGLIKKLNETGGCMYQIAVVSKIS